MARFKEVDFKVGKQTVRCVADHNGSGVHPMMKHKNGNIQTLPSGSVPVLADDKGAVPATLAEAKAAFFLGESKREGASESSVKEKWAAMQGEPVAAEKAIVSKGK